MVSKSLFTFLIQAADINLNDQVTKYISELQEAAATLNATENPLDHVAWEDATVGELWVIWQILQENTEGSENLLGRFLWLLSLPHFEFPTLNETKLPICVGGGFCTREQFLKGLTQRHSVYAPSTAAIDSNPAYQILSYALENITAVDFPAMVRKACISLSL
jgi:hypothetical protein